MPLHSSHLPSGTRPADLCAFTSNVALHTQPPDTFCAELVCLAVKDVNRALPLGPSLTPAMRFLCSVDLPPRSWVCLLSLQRRRLARRQTALACGLRHCTETPSCQPFHSACHCCCCRCRLLAGKIRTLHDDLSSAP